MQYILIVTLFLLPTYVIRFLLFGIPLNVLMVWIVVVWAFFAVWLIKEKKIKLFRQSVSAHNKFFLSTIGLFFLSGIIALFTGGFAKDKLGQFIVLFLQPISLYFISRFIYQNVVNARESFFRAAIMFAGLAGLYAIVQYVTLFGLPPEYLGNSVEPKRALSFFEYPNAYALFIAPLLAFTFSKILELLNGFSLVNIKYRLYPILAWFIGVSGLVVSLSRGGWLGFTCSVVVGVLLFAKRDIKKIAAISSIFLIAVAFSVPVLRYRLLLPFLGEKSAISRVSLADTAVKMIKDEPVFGKGLLGYDKNFESYNTDPGLEHYKYPHNLFLSIWVDLGLFGVVSFLGVILYVLWVSYRNRSSAFFAAVLLFIIASVVHGFVDVPYFKNDLAVLFWIILGIL